MNSVKKKSVQILDQSFKIGRTDIIINYLAFADDLAIPTNDIQTPQKKAGIIKEIAEKVGLQILFEKQITQADMIFGVLNLISFLS